MSLSYTPRGDRVIVERASLPDAPSEGLVVPKSQQKPLDEGTVIAVGPKVDGIREGQQVCFLEFAGSPITIDGKEYLSMRDEEIHGIRGTTCAACEKDDRREWTEASEHTCINN